MKEINYTFIIPHKNRPDLVERCVKSVPERDDIQIIVVDDNSDEGKKPSFMRTNLEIVLLDSANSHGAGRARNVGLQLARGKWLLFADADDFYKEGFLNVLDKYKDSDIEVLYFSFEYRDGNSLELLPDLPFRRYFDTFDGTSEMLDQIKYHHNVPWTKMVNREMVVEKGIFFEEVPNGNDIFFSMSVGYHAGSIAVEKTPLYVYLKNENSILTTKNKPVNYHMCKITHRVKQNEWYNHIGHKEWKVSITKEVLSHIRSSQTKVLLILEIIKQLPNIYVHRKEWIKLICK